MKSLLVKALPVLICIAAASTVFTPAAVADLWDRKTTITFSGPVEIPGVHLAGWGVLPAGTYVFKVMNSQSNRHIVQIFNKEETVVYATILAIPNMRIKVTDETVVTFRERPAGQPPALRAWFYPGATWGEEFVYPKAMALELAQSNNTPVLYSQSETATEVTEPILPPAPPMVARMSDTPVMAYNSAGQEVELAQAVTPPPADMPAATAPAALPATGSSLGFVMLGGLLALGGAFGIRLLMKSRFA